jgi:hypothetical protein
MVRDAWGLTQAGLATRLTLAMLISSLEMSIAKLEKLFPRMEQSFSGVGKSF